MDAGSWQAIKDVLARALEQPAHERSAFVARECADPALRAEVLALLDSYERSDVLQSLAADDREYELNPGATVGPYVVKHPVGRGGGGEVYRVRDTRLQRDVALKLLAPSGDTEEGARRVREARAAAQLNHRGIAAIYDILDARGRVAIVMEYVPGESLGERLRSRPPDIPTVIAVGLEMTDAVAHAHATGIVHCDLKPGNMRFAADGSLKILDFGLARRSATATESSGHSSSSGVSGLTASSLEGLALGTPGYMSPEQLLGSAIDCRTDVYSMGVVLYEMAAGRRPFGGSEKPSRTRSGGAASDAAGAMSTAVAVLSSPLPDLPREVPRRLRSIILKCLSRPAEQRYASGIELRDALAALGTPSWRIGWNRTIKGS